ncbi:MAG: 50S ribosomal protein L30 [Acidimicrobiia bacterium]|nr:50S ribosomal protein L30 [Acidimicrobiia bacterium]NND83821.1 50S ribosomal protein L30 [Acidimicrobiia bacterium]
MADLKITLTKSLIGEKPKTRATVRGLGLRRMHQTVIQKDNDVTRGMIRRVAHLVAVEEEK